jgi:hypothetical protein
VRDRDLTFEAAVAQHLDGRQLVRRVGIGVQERDGDAGDPFGREDLCGGAHVFELDRDVHRPVEEQALGDRDPQAPGHKRRRVLPEQVVRIVAVAAPDLEDVTEAPGGKQPDHGARPGQQRIEPDRRSVQEVLGHTETLLRHRGCDGCEHAFLGRIRGRRLLAHANLSRLVVVEDQVGERPAYVDADARGHLSTPSW